MKMLLLLLTFLPVVLPAQSRKQRKAAEAQQKADQQIIASIGSHIQFLTSNDDAAEKEYIAKQFAAAGLKAKGTDGYFQPFMADQGKQVGTETFLKVNGNLLQPGKDYIPLPWSASKSASGMPAMALREKGVPWFTDLKDLLENAPGQPINPELEIQKEAVKSAAKGATALFIYNSSPNAEDFKFNGKNVTLSAPIPVISILSGGYKKYFSDHADILDIELNVSIKDKKIRGSNIAGYIDNGAPYTTLLCSDYGNVPSYIHTDSANEKIRHSTLANAKGTAVLIELARILATPKFASVNYLFIAFNHEEQEMAGSSYWKDHSTISSPANYALVLNPGDAQIAAGQISIGGYQTAAAWKDILATATGRNAEIILDTAAGTLVSRSIFYEKQIPFLTFEASAGATADARMDLKMARIVTDVIESAFPKNKIVYAGTAAPDNTIGSVANEQKVGKKTDSSSSFANHSEPAAYPNKTMVSLGVIPDKSNAADGLRINGVSPKKLASRIGLQPGDVLTYLGSYKIGDIKTYMQALSNFKPGDKTVLGIKRGKEDKEFNVEF